MAQTEINKGRRRLLIAATSVVGAAGAAAVAVAIPRLLVAECAGAGSRRAR